MTERFVMHKRTQCVRRVTGARGDALHFAQVIKAGGETFFWATADECMELGPDPARNVSFARHVSENVAYRARPPTVFNEISMSTAWDSAIRLLEGSGVRVADLLREGARNVEAYKSPQLHFPVSMPDDEC